MSRRIQGFSLIECLVVMAIVLVAAALSFPIYQHTRKRTDAVQCLHHLRSIGVLLLYAAREQGPLFNAWYIGDTGTMWNTMLITKGYATHATLAALSCPEIPYASASGSISGRHYGIFAGDAYGKAVSITDELNRSGVVYQLPIRTHPAPGNALFLADSVSAAGNPSIRIFSGSNTPIRNGSTSFAGGGIHLRHQNAANLFFLDGHVEISKPDRLYELGARSVYNKKLQRMELTAP